MIGFDCFKKGFRQFGLQSICANLTGSAKFLPELESKLGDAAASFNDVAYGERPGTESGYRNIAELDEQIRSRRFAASGDGTAHGGTESWAHLQ